MASCQVRRAVWAFHCAAVTDAPDARRPVKGRLAIPMASAAADPLGVDHLFYVSSPFCGIQTRFPLQQNIRPAIQNRPVQRVIRLRGLFIPSYGLAGGFPIFMELYDASSLQGFRSRG